MGSQQWEVNKNVWQLQWEFALCSRSVKTVIDIGFFLTSGVVLSIRQMILRISQHQQDRSSHGPEVRITSFREYPPLVSTAIHHLMAGKCQYVAKEAPHQLALGGWEHVTLRLHNVFLFLFYCYALATHTF